MCADTSGHEMALAQAEAMIERQADEISRLRDENESLRGSLEEWKLDLNSLRDELENLRQPAKWRTCATHGDDKPNVWGCPECLRELRDENARLRDDQEECDALRGKMADILTRTANALRGDPDPLHLHSWHDLPERVIAVMNALAGAMELASAHVMHDSDCATHNEPAYPNGPCDCSAAMQKGE